MAKFLVTMGFTTVCTHEVEAHSFEEAKARAEELEWDYHTESESDTEVMDIDLMPGQVHMLDQLTPYEQSEVDKRMKGDDVCWECGRHNCHEGHY